MNLFGEAGMRFLPGVRLSIVEGGFWWIDAGFDFDGDSPTLSRLTRMAGIVLSSALLFVRTRL